MEKNQKILLAIIGVLIVIFAVIGFLAYRNEKIKPNKVMNKFKEEYEVLNGTVNDDGYTYPTVEIDEENPIVYKSDEEILKILKHGSGVIYFGIPTNPYCRNIIKPLLSAADSTDIKEINYIDIKDFRDILNIDDNGEVVVEKEGSSNYKDILEKLDEILQEYYIKDKNDNLVATGEKRIEVPLVVAISEGKIIDYHYSTVDSNINFENSYTELTKEEQEELYDIFVSMMTKLNESTCEEHTKGC